jgi:hypothetical protein
MDINIIARATSNAYQLLKFFVTKKRGKVIYFRVPTSVLLSYLDYNIINTVSNRIEFASTLDLNNIPKQFDEDMYLDSYGTNQVKHLIKLGWLISELKTNKINNPMQLLKSQYKYFCHPGTDRLIVATYIHPVEYIEGFYIWYSDIDKDPFILDYDYHEITNPVSFAKLFKYSKSFKFRSVMLTDTLDVSDGNGCAILNTAKTCFAKTTKDFEYLFLTYSDKMQLDNMNKLTLADVISFPDQDTCIFSNVTFKKINGRWIRYD